MKKTCLLGGVLCLCLAVSLTPVSAQQRGESYYRTEENFGSSVPPGDGSDPGSSARRDEVGANGMSDRNALDQGPGYNTSGSLTDHRGWPEPSGPSGRTEKPQNGEYGGIWGNYPTQSGTYPNPEAPEPPGPLHLPPGSAG